MNIELELKNIIEKKTGNKELALFFDGYLTWTLSLGNPTDCVSLGEAEGELETEEETIEQAIIAMKAKLKGG